MENERRRAYRLLGVPADSDPDTVARAYRRLARASHPDVSTDPAAADRFEALTAAYRLASRTPPAEACGSTEAPVARSEPESNRLAGGWGWLRPPVVAGPVHIRPIRCTGDEA